MFDIKFNKEENFEVLVSGDLDINTVSTFQDKVLQEYKDQDCDLVFNLENLDYIDSTGLGAIVTVYKEVTEKGKKVKVINAKKNIKKLFLITELDSLIDLGE